MTVELNIHPVADGLPEKDGNYYVWDDQGLPSMCRFALSVYEATGVDSMRDSDGKIIPDHPGFIDEQPDQYGYNYSYEVPDFCVAYWAEMPLVFKEISK